MVFAGWRLLPTRTPGERPPDLAASMGELSEAYALQGDLYRLRVRSGSGLAGKTLKEARLGRDFDVSVLEINRNRAPGTDSRRPREIIKEQLTELPFYTEEPPLPGPDSEIRVDDILLVKGAEAAIQRLMGRFKLGMQPVDGNEQELAQTLLSSEVGMSEVLVTPRSTYVGQTLESSQFAQKFNVQVLGIRRKDKTLHQPNVKLAFGDSLLVRGTWSAIGRLGRERGNFVVVGSPEEMSQQIPELTFHSYIALLALAGMVVLMVTGWTSAVIATLLTALVMVLAGCLTTGEAYRSVSLSTVVLVAAMMPMSIALEITGGAELLANILVNTLGSIHPMVLLAGVFLLTTGFSQVISNTATVVLMAPIVLQAALDSRISPHTALMMVAVAASAAFLTPIASPVNTLVLNPGSYSFGDYVKAGLPLMVIFFVVSMALVPLIWPLYG